MKEIDIKLIMLLIRSSIKSYPKSNYSLLEINSGDWYDDDIDKTIKNINEKTSELGYAFIEVIPRIKKLSETINLE